MTTDEIIEKVMKACPFFDKHNIKQSLKLAIQLAQEEEREKLMDQISVWITSLESYENGMDSDAPVEVLNNMLLMKKLNHNEEKKNEKQN